MLPRDRQALNFGWSNALLRVPEVVYTEAENFLAGCHDDISAPNALLIEKRQYDHRRQWPDIPFWSACGAKLTCGGATFASPEPTRTLIKLGWKWLGANARSLRAAAPRSALSRSRRIRHRRPRGAMHEIDEAERVRRLHVAAPSDMLVRANQHELVAIESRITARGPVLPISDVRYHVSLGGLADVTRTSYHGPK